MKKPNLDLNDIFFIVGLGLFTSGIGILSVPAAMIATGGLFLAIALIGAIRKR
jgi:hypothetical protein